MRMLFVLLAATFFVACNSSNDTEKPGSDTTVPVTDVNVAPNTSFPSTSIGAGELPTSIKYKGKFQQAWKWNDKLGENILLLSLVPAAQDKTKSGDDEETWSSELFAFHFVKKDSGYRKIWMIADGEKACPFDITNEFLKDATMITDLDNNGIAETTVQYKLACRSDVSPSYMKLVMHEDSVKFALRGAQWVKTGETDSFTVTADNVNLEKIELNKDEFEAMLQRFGRYESEKEFSKAPPSFLNFAREQWLKNAKEIFESTP